MKMINFLQPGIILIVTGILVLLIPERLINLRRGLLVLAPVILFALFTRSRKAEKRAKVWIAVTALLGFSLSDNTLLVNLAPGFSAAAERLSTEEERLLAYSMVNTLCMNERIKSVCFFRSGSQFEGFGGEIYWGGLFYPLPY